MERKNLWAPWRIKYIQALTEKNPCFLCHNREHPEEDKKNFVLWRTTKSIVVFNKFPYNNGHLLIAPKRHIPDLSQANQDEMADMMNLIRDCQTMLTATIKPHGFNVGMNFGRCAGAGLPDHLHIHVVPRWDGDTNFMHVCSDTDVISQSMNDLYDMLIETGKKLGLPTGLENDISKG